MNDDALFSFLLQITIRYTLKIGDFATRNFLRIKNKVYNLDTEGVNVGNTIRLAKKEIDILKKFIKNERERYVQIIQTWLENESAWNIVRMTLDINVDDCLTTLRKILNNQIEWLGSR